MIDTKKIYHSSIVAQDRYSMYIERASRNDAFVDWEVRSFPTPSGEFPAFVKDLLFITAVWKETY